mgnify:CR=1 FL=1
MEPSKESSAIYGNSGAKKIGTGILLSRLAGLLRESLLRSVLGLGPAADAFTAALRIPNLLQNLLGEGSLSSSFIPVYSKLLSEGKEKEAGHTAGAVAGLLIAFTGALTLVGILIARPIAKLLTPGFSSEKLDLTADLIKITTAGIGFLVLAAWCLGVLNSHRKFFLSYVAPVIWNAAQIVILFIAIGKDWDPVKAARAAAWGLFIGGVIQLLFQFFGVSRLRTKIGFSFSWKNEHVREIIRRFNPTILGRGVVQISAYFDLVLASLLVTGAVAALMSAQVLYILPISLFAMSIAAAELPEMSRNTDSQHLSNRLNQGIKQTSFLMLLTSVIYMTIGDQIIGVIFQWGSFDRDDTIVVAATLAAYSLGIPAIGISRIYQSALYANGDTKTPAFSATLRVIISLIIGLLLMFPLDRLFISNSALEKVPGSIVGDWGPLSQSLRSLPENPHLGAVGLAVGSAIAAWAEMVFLARKTNKKVTPESSPYSPMVKLLPATFSALMISIIARWLLSDANAVINCLVCIPAATLAYIAVSSKNGVQESVVLLEGLKRKLQNFK